MNIAILATNASLYSHQRLMSAGREAGHQMQIINPLFCYMNVEVNCPQMHYRGGQELPHFDAVIPRIGASNTFCAII